MTLGERLAEVRSLAGISTRALDRLAGLTEGHCWLIEKSKTKNTATATIDNLAAVLGVSLDYLVRGEGEEPTAEVVLAAVAAAKRRKTQPDESDFASDTEPPANVA